MANITHVPTEFLEDIFHHSLPTLFKGRDGLLKIYPDVEDDPLSLQMDLSREFTPTDEVGRARTHLLLVCHSWRKIILGLAKIWSRLEVNVDVFQKRTKKLTALLDRSGNYDLEIKLVSGRQEDRSTRIYTTLAQNAGTQQVLDILREQFHRVRLFAIDFNMFGLQIDLSTRCLLAESWDNPASFCVHSLRHPSTHIRTPSSPSAGPPHRPKIHTTTLISTPLPSPITREMPSPVVSAPPPPFAPAPTTAAFPSSIPPSSSSISPPSISTPSITPQPPKPAYCSLLRLAQ
ncbi:hypothetical protein M422DRAFT_263812 [Sphaerobolus stellatus SS14]|uniref:F-box domain-containing protein n=1 Tax=Sphaerobolus stellatus (strain SS14) TaxID=990650 RepID=A0A0C9UH40_SPHS4|nr:hypothetical protein M422DRAFT_263812 [Sphaerobolus stellatus SS14]